MAGVPKANVEGVTISGPLAPEQPVAMLPLTRTTTGTANPLLAALGAATVTEPVFKPLHKPTGLISTGTVAGVVVDDWDGTLIHGVLVDALTGVAELSLAKRFRTGSTVGARMAGL